MAVASASIYLLNVVSRCKDQHRESGFVRNPSRGCRGRSESSSRDFHGNRGEHSFFYAPCVCVLRQMNPRPKHSGFMVCSSVNRASQNP